MEKEEFYRKYEEYYGGNINEIPYLLEGKDIWLYDLYLSVLKHGGYSCVSRNAKWLKIGKEFGLINKEKNIRLIEIKNIKEYYLNYLREFERIHDNLKKGKILTKKYRCRVGINNIDVKNKKKSVVNSNGNNIAISSKGINNKRSVPNSGKGNTNIIIDGSRFDGVNKDSFFVKDEIFRVENGLTIDKNKINIENEMSTLNYPTNNNLNNNIEVNCKAKKEVYHDSYTKESRKNEGKYKKNRRNTIFRNCNNIGVEINNGNNNDIVRGIEIDNIQNNEEIGRYSDDIQVKKGKINNNNNNKEIEDQIINNENFVNINNMSCYNFTYNTINNYQNNLNYMNYLNITNYGDNRYIGNSDYNNNIYSSNFNNSSIFNSHIKNENYISKCENSNYIGISYINNNFVDANCSTLKFLNENNYSEYNDSPIISIGNNTFPTNVGYMNYGFLNENSKNNNIGNNYNNLNGGLLNNNLYVDNIGNYMNNESYENNINDLKNGVNVIYEQGKNITNNVKETDNHKYNFENNKDMILSKIENEKCIDIYRLLLGLYKRKENVGDFILCLNILYSISKMENIISKKQTRIVIWSLLHVLEDILKIFYDGFNSKKRSVYILMFFFKDSLLRNKSIEKRERNIISNMKSDSSQYILEQTLKDSSNMANSKKKKIEGEKCESEKRNEKNPRLNNNNILANILFLNKKIEIREMLDLHLSYYEYCIEKKKKIKRIYELGEKWTEQKDKRKKINKNFDEKNEVCAENIRNNTDSSTSSYYCSSVHSTDIENMNMILRNKDRHDLNCSYFYKDKKYVKNILTKKSSVDFVFIILYILNNMFQISKYNLHFFNMSANYKEKDNEHVCDIDKNKKTAENWNVSKNKNEMDTMLTPLNEENKNILKKEELLNNQIPKNDFYDVSSSDVSSSICSMNSCINTDINLFSSLKSGGNITVNNSKDILYYKNNNNMNEYEKSEFEKNRYSLYKPSYNKVDGQDSWKLIDSEIKEGNKTKKYDIKNSEGDNVCTEDCEENHLPKLPCDDTENWGNNVEILNIKNNKTGTENESEKCALKIDSTNLNNNNRSSIDNSKETNKVNKNKKEVREIYKNLQNEMYKDMKKLFIKKKRKETKYKLIHYFYLSKFLSIFETIFLKNFENIIYHEKVIENVYINMFICIDIINKELGTNISLKYIFFPSQYLEKMNKMKIVAHFSSDNKFYLFSNQENRKNNKPKKNDEMHKDDFGKDNKNESINCGKINIEPFSKFVSKDENSENRGNERCGENRNNLDDNMKDEIRRGQEEKDNGNVNMKSVNIAEKDGVKINGNNNKEMDGNKYKKKMRKLFLKIFRKNNRKYNIYKKIDDKYLKEHYNYFESFCCKEKEKMEKDILLNLHGITKNILLKIYKRVNKYLNIGMLSLNILAHILYLIPKKLFYVSIIPWILNNIINVKCCYTYVNIPLCILNYNGFIFLETFMKFIIQMIRNNMLSIKSYIFSFLRLSSFPLYIYIHFDIPLSHNLILTSLCLIYKLVTYDPDYLATGLIIEREFQNEASSVFYDKGIEVENNNEDNIYIKNNSKKRKIVQTKYVSSNTSPFENITNDSFQICESISNERSVKCEFNTNKNTEKERKNEKREGTKNYDQDNISGKRNELLEKTFLKTLFLFLKKFIYFKSILNCANINDIDEMVVDSKRVQDILNNWNLNNKDVKFRNSEHYTSNVEKKIFYLHDNLIIYAKENKINSNCVKDIKTCYNIINRYRNQYNTTSNYSYEYMASNNPETQKLSIYAHSIISILLFLSSHHNLWESLSPYIPLLVHMALIRTDVSSSLWIVLKEYYFRNFMRQKRSPQKCRKYYNSKVVEIEKVK
ncbi:conserved Plasmodium protein, unknown function [Plasmodium berghei]|uniref:ARID domain-containing protein n=1 Tax=Plasmodium berghei TaxID=5821 RepID=A0A1D3S5N3_PLABE|nr:conserved Plasmodium protein, unknown function [Plasmodium berghei]